MDGCPSDNGDKKKEILNLTILDCVDTTPEKLIQSGHKSKYCECRECLRAKKCEDIWIARLGTMSGTTGLNTKEDAV